MVARRVASSIVLLAGLSGCVPTTGFLTATPVEKTPPYPALAQTATPSPAPTALPTEPLLPTPTLQQSYAQAHAMLPAFSQDVFTLPDATRYWIQVRVEFDAEQQKATLEGTARLRFRNTEAEALEDVVLMLWPNDGQYRSSMSVGPALVDGRTLEGKEQLSGIAIRFQLADPAPPKAWVDLTVPFLVEAEGPIGEAKPRRFGITRGVLVAPTFYPLLPRRSGGAWQVEPAPYGGDTTNSDVAFYQVGFDVPDDLVLAASGVEVARNEPADGRLEVWYVSGPMRDFAFALGPFATLEQTAAGTRVRGLVLPEHKGELLSMVSAAAKQMELLNEIVGQYPYAELDLVDSPGAFGGIEYPGLVFIGTLGTPNVTGTTVHEVAHQWFYGVVGNDQIREPWLDEAAATYGDILYQEHVFGSGRSTGTLGYYRSLVRELAVPDTPIGWPVGEYGSVSEYALIVYVKGALFFDALRAAMGEDEFLGFLKDYYQTYRYGFVNTAEFQDLAENHCGCALTGLFDLWVYQGGEIPGQ